MPSASARQPSSRESENRLRCHCAFVYGGLRQPGGGLPRTARRVAGAWRQPSQFFPVLDQQTLRRESVALNTPSHGNSRRPTVVRLELPRVHAFTQDALPTAQVPARRQALAGVEGPSRTPTQRLSDPDALRGSTSPGSRCDTPGWTPCSTNYAAILRYVGCWGLNQTTAYRTSG
jgi:hypothetical protein